MKSWFSLQYTVKLYMVAHTHTPVILSHGKWQQEDQEFKVYFGYTTEFKVRLSYVRPLPEKQKIPKIYFSYVWSNLSLVNSFLKHLLKHYYKEERRHKKLLSLKIKYTL